MQIANEILDRKDMSHDWSKVFPIYKKKSYYNSYRGVKHSEKWQKSCLKKVKNSDT